ncbi:MAG: 50S ribosomal protein L13 [Thermoproteota archaeon]
MSTAELLVVNAEGQILGRMASRIAKLLLEGKKVTVVNAEKAIISGKKSSIVNEYGEFLDIKSRVQPKYTPRHSRKPENFIKAVVKGMLPRRKHKGVSALRRLKVYVGDPGGYVTNPIKFADADASRLKERYITIEELLSKFRGNVRTSKG